MTRLHVRLYVAGDGPNSVRAIANLRRYVVGCPKNDVRVEVVDVLEEPERALRDGVLVTPTTVRVAPSPERRIVGDLRNERVVRAALGLEGERPDG
jgi:circadian clock protein KaiB